MRRLRDWLSVQVSTRSPSPASPMHPCDTLVFVGSAVTRMQKWVGWLIALALTVLAAMRWPVFPTVVIGVVSAGLLRYLLG